MRMAVFFALLGCRSSPAIPPIDERESEIRRYVKRLESKNAHVSLDAVDYLPYFGRDAVPALVEELKSRSANGRALAAATLARIPDARSVEPLLALLDDKAALELNVLSDDGESLHGAYDNPLADFVQQQARAALQSITGQRWSKKEDWEKWWNRNRETFEPARSEAKSPWPIPPHANRLKGFKICLDPGHGGDTHKRGFKRGPTYASEAEINLRVARFLRDSLIAQGAEVTMTRDSDKDVDLADRAKLAAGRDFFLSIHHNWSPRLDAESTTTWYHLTPDHQPAAIDLARYVERAVLQAIDVREPRAGGLMSDGLMYETGFGVLRQLPADVPGCLCEMTYYSSLALERKLRDIEFNRREAYGLFVGIAEYAYYGIPRAEIVSNESRLLTFKVYDGLEDRGEWAKPFKIFREHTLVKIDEKIVAHEYDEKSGTISVRHELAPGPHEALVTLINLHKNHSFPKSIRFEVKQ